MPRQRPRPATGKRNSKHKPKLDVPEPELTAMLEQYYDLRTQLVIVDHRRLSERPTASPERKSMPPTASTTSVPHHEGGYRGRYAYSERCTCGNHIETDDPETQPSAESLTRITAPQKPENTSVAYHSAARAGDTLQPFHLGRGVWNHPTRSLTPDPVRP